MGVTLKIMEHLKNDELMNNDMDAYARVSDFNFTLFLFLNSLLFKILYFNYTGFWGFGEIGRAHV